MQQRQRCQSAHREDLKKCKSTLRIYVEHKKQSLSTIFPEKPRFPLPAIPQNPADHPPLSIPRTPPPPLTKTVQITQPSAEAKAAAPPAIIRTEHQGAAAFIAVMLIRRSAIRRLARDISRVFGRRASSFRARAGGFLRTRACKRVHLCVCTRKGKRGGGAVYARFGRYGIPACSAAAAGVACGGDRLGAAINMGLNANTAPLLC